jgi:hypothetical protein
VLDLSTQDAIDKLLAFLENDGRFNRLEIKFSYSEKLPFKRLKVKLKKEIVTLGVEHIDPLSSVGTYVKPKDWNTLITSNLSIASCVPATVPFKPSNAKSSVPFMSKSTINARKGVRNSLKSSKRTNW